MENIPKYKIENVNGSFDVINEKLFCICNDKFTVFDANGQSCYEGINGDAVSLCVIEDSVISQKIGEQKSIVIDPENLATKKSLNFLIDVYPELKKTHFTKDFFYPICGEENAFFRGKVSLTNFELENRYPLNCGRNGVSKVLNDDVFISMNNTGISCHNFVDCSEIWSLEYKEMFTGIKIMPADLKQFGQIIFCNEKLFIYLADNVNIDFRATFVIDVNTGKLIKTIDGFTGDLFLCNNSIYSANKYLVQVLDTATLNFEVLDLESELKIYSLEICYGKSVMTKEKMLYFVNGSGLPSNRIGILDLNKQKIIWHTTLTNAADCIDEIRIYDTQLFVHTLNKTLYAFA